MINKQVSEDDLRRIMQLVHLEHIVERDTFHAVKDWTDILSGGEKQRMAIARLFYHKSVTKQLCYDSNNNFLFCSD